MIAGAPRAYCSALDSIGRACVQLEFLRPRTDTISSLLVRADEQTYRHKMTPRALLCQDDVCVNHGQREEGTVDPVEEATVSREH